jgi:hypothetical protein
MLGREKMEPQSWIVYRLHIYRSRLGQDYTGGSITAHTHNDSLTRNTFDCVGI